MIRVAPTKALAHVDRLGAWKLGEHAAPVTVEWDLSNRCVLGCSYGGAICHFAHTHVRGPWTTNGRRVIPLAFDPTGDIAEPRVVRRGLAQMREAGVQAVVWSGGGEPTTHPEWTEIVAFASSLGLRQGMYTLGGLLSRETAAKLAAATDWVVVSLDAADAETYAADKGVPPDRFEAACNGIRHLAAARPATVVGVSFLLHEGNWTSADRMRSLARTLGASYVTFRPVIDTLPNDPATIRADRAWIAEALTTFRWLAEDPFVEIDPDRFVEYAEWRGRDYDTCHGIKLNATVTPDGRVWLCPQRRGVDGSCVGDLSREQFSEIWRRHPGVWTDFSGCRAMCRLHLVNRVLAPVFAAHVNEAFV